MLVVDSSNDGDNASAVSTPHSSGPSSPSPFEAPQSTFSLQKLVPALMHSPNLGSQTFSPSSSSSLGAQEFEYLEVLVVMLLRLGCRSDRSYIWGVPLHVPRRSFRNETTKASVDDARDWVFVLFAGALLYWLPKLRDNHKGEKIQAKIIQAFLRSLVQRNPWPVELPESSMAECCRFSPFYLSSEGKPSLSALALQKKRCRELPKNFYAIHPQVLLDLCRKHPNACFQGDYSQLDVQKRMNLRNGVLLPLELLRNAHYTSKVKGVIKGLQSLPPVSVLQQMAQREFKRKDEFGFECWLPYGVPKGFFQDDARLLAWKKLQAHSLWGEMTRYGASLPTFIGAKWGVCHLGWGWQLALDDAKQEQPVLSFADLLRNILTGEMDVFHVYRQATPDASNRSHKKRKSTASPSASSGRLKKAPQKKG